MSRAGVMATENGCAEKNCGQIHLAHPFSVFASIICNNKIDKITNGLVYVRIHLMRCGALHGTLSSFGTKARLLATAARRGHNEQLISRE